MQKIFSFLAIILISNLLFIPFSKAEEKKLPIIPLEKKSLQDKKSKNYQEGEIIVKYKSQEKKQRALEKIKNKTDKKDLELEIKGEIDNFKLALFKSKKISTQDLIKEFEKDDMVEFAEPNFRKERAFIPNDDYYYYVNQWSLDNTGQSIDGISGTPDADIDAPEAWDAESIFASETIVAVIDDGVDYNHPDLINNMWNGSNCVDHNGSVIIGGCPYHGWDYANNDNDPYNENYTDNYHGTFVSSVLASQTDNGISMSGLSRYNKIKIMALKFDLYLFSELDSIDFAINNDAKVINASFTGEDFSQAEKDAIENFNGVFVTAAGNYASNNENTPAYPCNYDSPNIICVASSDQDDMLSSFSNYGTTSVDIMAPGENILGIYQGELDDGTSDRSNYAFNAGTSFATPMVAGAAALLYAHSPLASFATIRSTLLQSSDHISTYSTYIYCGRRLNTKTSLQSIINSEILNESCSLNIFLNYSKWISGHGLTSNNQFLADVNGDGKNDSIVYFASTGEWYVSLSDGIKFLAYTKWISGHGVGSVRQLMADVNGDGKADAIVFFSDGRWYVATAKSTGGFNPYALWISGHGLTSNNQFLADVNGDGKNDSIVYFASTGEWYVSLSDGIKFLAYTKWISGHGVGSVRQLMADVNGDGKADAIVFFSDGRWYVATAKSTGGFNPYALWISGHGLTSNNQFLADVNGDGKNDSIVYFASTGEWYVSLSDGIKFLAYTKWISGHGVGSVRQLMADVNGDGKADAIVFFSDGRWYVAISN